MINYEGYVNKLKGLDPVYKGLIGIGLFITLFYGVFSCAFLLLIGFPILFKVYLKWSCGKTSSRARIDGKIVIVTGANVGLGYETTKDLAKRGGKIIMACRNEQKANKAAEQIRKEDPNADVVVMKLDLSSLKSVREFAKTFESEYNRLDILVNNAGAATNDKVLTEDKLETNMAANHFGPFLLTNLLLGLMKKTGNGRIVMVSSEMHMLAKSLDLDNLNCEKSFQTDMVYARTKVANILFTRELDRRFRAGKIREMTINALHPGLVKTEFVRHWDQVWWRTIINRLAQLFAKTVWEGAQTQIHLCVAEQVEELSGLYWADCQEIRISPLAQNVKLAKDLWTASAGAVGLKQDETIFEH